MAAAPVYSTRFKVVAALVITVAAAAFVTAYLATQQGSDDPVVSSGAASEAVESLIPDRGAQVPQQQPTIGVDLAGGWDAALAVNGVEIPDDELDVTPELSLVQFTPADGRAVEQFRPGRNCVEATIWPLSAGRDGEETRTVGWCFDVV
ncbi:MAG TPA: hypothetical protein VFZ68_05565 [Acidimicrobiales bacterium]